MALSHSVRELLCLKSHIKEVIDNLVIDSAKLMFVSRFTVYKENNGAIFVKTSSSMTTTSKHFDVKYHWFRQNIRKEFVIQKIESENQMADIFTKDLQVKLFIRISNLICCC